MTTVDAQPNHMTRAARAVRRRLRSLMFAPVSAFPLAVFRVVLGATVVAWAVTMALDAAEFLGDDAIVPPSLADGAFGVELTRDLAVRVTLAVLTVAGIGITVGFRPTVCAVAAFVLLVLLQRRNPTIVNSGDLLLRDLTLLLALTPSGAALSVDRLRRHGRAALRTAPSIAPWGLRLVQLQVVVVYFVAFWSKSGTTWHDGTAVSTALRLDDLQRLPAPSLLIEQPLAVAALTWGTLAVELALATLLWFRPARPILVAIGVAFHLLIDTFLLVGFFGVAMIAGLATFLDGDAIERRLGRPRLEPTDDPAIPTSPTSPTSEVGSDDGAGNVEAWSTSTSP